MNDSFSDGWITLVSVSDRHTPWSLKSHITESFLVPNYVSAIIPKSNLLSGNCSKIKCFRDRVPVTRHSSSMVNFVGISPDIHVVRQHLKLKMEFLKITENSYHPILRVCLLKWQILRNMNMCFLEQQGFISS